MKLTLALFVAAAVLGCVLSCTDEDFANFKSKYEKTYASEEEHSLRKETFCKNMREIQEHNQLYDQGKSTFKQGINQFSDWTTEEVNKSHKGYGGRSKQD